MRLAFGRPVLVLVILVTSLASVAGCSDGQTYGFDPSGSYTVDAVLSVGAVSRTSEGSVTPMPGATLSFDGAGALTLWPGCQVAISETGTESTHDEHDQGGVFGQKSNGDDRQDSDTYDLAYVYAVAPKQACSIGPNGDQQMYSIGDGSLRFTVDGMVSGNVGGTQASAPFVLTFDGQQR